MVLHVIGKKQFSLENTCSDREIAHVIVLCVTLIQ